MANLKGTKTEDNLKAAFAGESQANRRYLYFAQKADVEGYNDVAAVFRSTAEGETGHAHGHLEFLEESRRPGDRPADRHDRRQPQGRDRRRDPRIHRHVSGHGAHRARGRLRRNRRLVRDPGQGREVHAGRFQKALDDAGRERRSALSEAGRRRGVHLSCRSAIRLRRPRAKQDRHACAKAASKRRPGTRSTGRIPTSTTWPSSTPRCERVFDICHGCRRCFNLCDSFPRLFDLIDKSPTGEARRRRRRPTTRRSSTPARSATCAS